MHDARLQLANAYQGRPSAPPRVVVGATPAPASDDAPTTRAAFTARDALSVIASVVTIYAFLRNR